MLGIVKRVGVQNGKEFLHNGIDGSVYMITVEYERLKSGEELYKTVEDGAAATTEEEEGDTDDALCWL